MEDEELELLITLEELEELIELLLMLLDDALCANAGTELARRESPTRKETGLFMVNGE